MQFTKSLVVLASASSALAQMRPSNTSVCDYYTTALLKDNTGENQYKVLQLIVNTVIIGNYTMPNVGVSVPGILKPAQFMGENVNLAPYFSGALQSSNRGGKAVAVNFLDGGAAAPLMANKMPTSGSNQETLVTHLYEYFGALLGCTMYGKSGFPAYDGTTSMYQVHRFMALTPAEVGYFINQVGMSAASFGVSMDDVTMVGQTLSKAFNVKCAPAVALLPNEMPELQSICVDSSCPNSPNATCSAYPSGGTSMEPTNATMPAMNGTSGGSGSSGSGSGSSGSSGSGSGSSGSGSNSGNMGASSNGASLNAASFGAAILGAAAFAFAL